MTELSPAAQAVLDHFLADCEISARHGIAAAIEVLADQVVPEDDPKSFIPGAPRSFALQRRATRRDLLAIAAELRGANTL